MNRLAHDVYVFTLSAIVVTVFFLLTIFGIEYYSTGIAERHFHPQYDILKPTGTIGHGIGIAGSAFLIIGVFGYMARKRFRRFSQIGKLKYWLEFHIFLCVLGPVLILYHTTFRIGGIVAVSFWSMVAVVVSGVIGRFIYLQIPRTIQGRELSMSDLNSIETDLYSELKNKYNIDYGIILKLNDKLSARTPNEGANFLVRIVKRFRFERQLIKEIKSELKMKKLSGRNFRKVVKLFKSKIKLNRRINWLSSMQNYLRYWHVAHLPFALIMLVIMLIHITVAILFGYTWIF